MSFLVQMGGRERGPYAVLDTALNEAIKITKPPPKPPKPLTNVARTLGTTDEDPYGPVTPRQPQSATVIEVDDRRRDRRIRAYVDDGRLYWAIECKACQGTGQATGQSVNWMYGSSTACTACYGVGLVRDLKGP